MRKRIDIHDHETLASLAQKYPGRSIRWMRDRPASTVTLISPRTDRFNAHYAHVSVSSGHWHRQA